MELLVLVNVQARRMVVNRALSRGNAMATLVRANDLNLHDDLNLNNDSNSYVLNRGTLISGAPTATMLVTQRKAVRHAGQEMASGLAKANHPVATSGLSNMLRTRPRLQWSIHLSHVSNLSHVSFNSHVS
jgi:hypothetical protein